MENQRTGTVLTRAPGQGDIQGHLIFILQLLPELCSFYTAEENKTIKHNLQVQESTDLLAHYCSYAGVITWDIVTCVSIIDFTSSAARACTYSTEVDVVDIGVVFDANERCVIQV